MSRPRIYIAHSPKSGAAARALQSLLDPDYDTSLPSQGVLAPSKTVIESLEAATEDFDFAIFLFEPPDSPPAVGSEEPASDSDLRFQVGLFMGKIGRERTFLVYQERAENLDQLRLPEATILKYRVHDSGNLEASLGAVASRISTRIRTISNVSSRHLLSAARGCALPLSTASIAAKEVGTVYDNLPAPAYSFFISRRKLSAELRGALSARSPFLAVIGFGGAGKTSLVREVVSQCLNNDDRSIRLDAVVWVSDKGRLGLTTLNCVLDTIAFTLDYPGLIKYCPDDKRRAVERLLRNNRVAVVVDNFETITDPSLIEWIYSCPENSRVVVISRETLPHIPAGAPCINVPEMNEDETRDLIIHHLQLLQINHLVHDFSELKPLISCIGGNPKAIEVTLGYLKHRARPIQYLIQDLREAKGALFDDLFSRCWLILDEHGRKLLLSMALFPYGTNDGPLGFVFGGSRNIFHDRVERLIGLRLVDATQRSLGELAIYRLHPLVKTFIMSKLISLPEAERELRQRWLEYWEGVADSIGLCWDEISRLEILDAEGALDTIRLAIDWSYEHSHYRTMIRLASGVRYYFYVRGHWSGTPSIHEMRASAARALSDYQEEFEALTYQVNIFAKQGNIELAEKHLLRLEEIRQTTKLSKESLTDFRHALALINLVKRDFQAAEELWRANLKELLPTSCHAFNTNTRWLAVCVLNQGRTQESMELFKNALRHAKEYRFLRAIVAIELQMATIYLDQEDILSASESLGRIKILTAEVKDGLYIADLEYLLCRLAQIRGQDDTAQAHLRIAADLYERLGLRERHRRPTRLIAREQQANTK